MSYVLFKLLNGGTFTTGIGADWRAQFGAAPIVIARPMVSGEVLYPGSGSGFGIYAAFAFRSRNPFDQTICIPEAAVGAPVQVYLNGVLVSEVTTPGVVTCSAISGANVLELVRSQAPLIAAPAGALIDPLGEIGSWVSLYPPGEDPFVAPTGRPGTPVAAIPLL